MNLIKKEELKIILQQKILLKKILHAIFNLLIMTYIGFSLFSLSGCAKSDDELSYGEQKSQHDQTIKLFAENFNAKVFNCDTRHVLNKTVVFDTLIIGVRNLGNRVILKARIKNNCDKNYFAELNCSKEIGEKFYKTKSNYAVVAAKVTGITDCDVVAEVDSLDGKSSQMELGKTILLTGECLALAEVPAIVGLN
jgi:hypothetical protein